MSAIPRRIPGRSGRPSTEPHVAAVAGEVLTQLPVVGPENGVMNVVGSRIAAATTTCETEYHHDFEHGQQYLAWSH